MFEDVVSFFVRILVFVVIFVLIAVIVYLIYLYLKKKEVNYYFPRKDFYDSEFYALSLYSNPFVKDLYLVSNEMPSVRLGKILNVKIEANDVEPNKIIDLKQIGADTIISFLVAFDSKLFRKLFPEKKVIKVFRRQIVNDSLIGDIGVKGTGIKPIGFFLTIQEPNSNIDKLMLNYLSYNAVVHSFEKAQDKWGQFATANVGQKEPFIAVKEREKINIELPFKKKE